MAYTIECSNSACQKKSQALHIVDLLWKHIKTARLVCPNCNQETAFIRKEFQLQEKGDPWRPFIKGAVRLRSTKEKTYQPFVFLTSEEENGQIDGFWFCYYKDTRDTGGKLKLGYGPGGPPVLDKEDLLVLLRHMVELSLLERGDLQSLLALAEKRID